MFQLSILICCKNSNFLHNTAKIEHVRRCFNKKQYFSISKFLTWLQNLKCTCDVSSWLQIVGVAYADILTHQFQVCQFTDSDQFINLESTIVQLGPKECLLLGSEALNPHLSTLRQLMERSSVLVTPRKKGEQFSRSLFR